MTGGGRGSMWLNVQVTSAQRKTKYVGWITESESKHILKSWTSLPIPMRRRDLIKVLCLGQKSLATCMQNGENVASWQRTHRQPRDLNASAAKLANTTKGSLATLPGRNIPTEGPTSLILPHPIKPAYWLQFQGTVETGTNLNLPKGELSDYFLWGMSERTGDDSLSEKDRIGSTRGCWWLVFTSLMNHTGFSCAAL